MATNRYDVTDEVLAQVWPELMPRESEPAEVPELVDDAAVVYELRRGCKVTQELEVVS